MLPLLVTIFIAPNCFTHACGYMPTARKSPLLPLLTRQVDYYGATPYAQGFKKMPLQFRSVWVHPRLHLQKVL